MSLVLHFHGLSFDPITTIASTIAITIPTDKSLSMFEMPPLSLVVIVYPAYIANSSIDLRCAVVSVASPIE